MRGEELIGKVILIPLSLIFIIFIPVWALADEVEGIKSSTELELQVSTMPEAKLRLIQSFTFPFLQGSGPLTKDNNVATVFSVDITPVSLFGVGEITWTPVAFFLLSGGGKAGSGWDIPLGRGVGITAPKDENAPDPGDPPRQSKFFGHAFDGLVWSTWGAGTFQFDLGAIIPGDWTHVVFQTRQEFRYMAYSKAGSGVLWVLENDEGENENGWTYYASYVLGYLMPLSPVLNGIAFMAELEKPLYKTAGGGDWGETLGKWIFSGIFNFSIHPRFNLAFAIQMRTRRNYGLYNFNDDDYYYPDLELRKAGGERPVFFYRAAVVLTYRIR